LAREVADTFGLDKQLISPVKSSFFPSIAPRPKNTSFKIDKMRSELPVCPAGIREGLALMKNNPPREWKYDWQG
ncbi:MAG: sugar nucleotide-binding protein, partial [Candidatus Omnitrophica bacterium]|nr:sugar nucleotide-binding protein [Candidatus Omnitrophota bacterium]